MRDDVRDEKCETLCRQDFSRLDVRDGAPLQNLVAESFRQAKRQDLATATPWLRGRSRAGNEVFPAWE